MNTRRRSIRFNISLAVLAVFLVSIWLIAFFIIRLLHKDMQQSLGEQQFSVVSLIATGINEQLETRLQALKTIAAEITPEIVKNRAVLQKHLEERPLLQNLFSGGTFVTGIDGTAMADVPLSARRIGVNYMDRETVSIPIKTNRSIIGKPVMGKRLLVPIFSIAVPIQDNHGKVIGVLVGTVNLGKPNFLDKIAEGHYGTSGGYLLIAPQHGLIVTASNKKLIMQPMPVKGVNKMHDRYVQGYEGYGVTVSSKGVEELTAAKSIPVAGWFMAVLLPTDEAFAPIHAMQSNMLLAMVLLTLLASPLTWWIVSLILTHQFSPMLQATKHLAAQASLKQTPQPIPITREDEIGELISSFNRLLSSLRQREEALHESESRLQAILQNEPEAITIVDSQGCLLQVNQAGLKMFGSNSHEQVAGKPLMDVIAPEYRDAFHDMHKRVILGESVQMEFEVLGLNGVRRIVETNAVPMLDKGQIVHLAVTRDITERKRLEDQVRQLAFHDTLTHLPNRRLLTDRLSQVMAASLRHNRYGALMFIDLDNFKPLNDAHGHSVGDLLLIEVAKRLTACVREMDTVARFGGDEFVVMLSELDVDHAEFNSQARIVAEKIQAALSSPYLLTVKENGAGVVEHHCSASIGVVLFVNHEISQNDILKYADAAMYQAKDAGRNSIRFYS